MSVIAWDGTTLAADKRYVSVGLHRRGTKIFRVGRELLGFSGNGAEGHDMLQWALGGFKPDQFPINQRDEKLWAPTMVISPSGQIRIYERSPYPWVVENKHHAIGSGRDYALAAMHLGRTSAQAVEIASMFEVGCGDGVDELTLDKS